MVLNCLLGINMGNNNRFRWVENWRFEALNSDPYFIIKLKRVRKLFRTWKNLLKTISIILIISSSFVYFGIENAVKDNLIYHIFMIFLNIVTFIGIVFPITIKKNIQEKDIKDIIDKKKEEDEKNERIEKMANL